MNSQEILDVLPLGIVVIDRHFKIEQWNRWMAMHSGMATEAVVGRELFALFPDLHKASFLRACKSVQAFGNVVYLSQKLHKFIFPFPLPSTLGSPLTHMQQSCSMNPIRDEAGEVRAVLITVQDVSDNVMLEYRLRQLNQTDSLTGAANRRFLDRRLGEELERFHRYDRDFAVCLMDVDLFKRVNDRHGHLAGDRVLISVCHLARKVLRGVDFFARYGGEEFCCILPETGLDEARMVAERIREKIGGHPFSWEKEQFQITISLGVAVAAADLTTPAQLLARADAALYAAKAGGRNQVRVG